MNTEQLKYLIEVSQNASISAASEKLFMTPQALSIALKKLEDELGLSLLKRSYKGATLTADGIWLVELADNFLSAIEKRKKYEKTLEHKSYVGDIDVAINISTPGIPLLARFICALSQKQTNLTIHFLELPKEKLLLEVLENQREMGLIFRTSYNGNYIDKLDNNLLFEPLFQGKHVILASPKYNFTKFNSTTLKKIVKYPLCSYCSQESYNWNKYFITEICNLKMNEMVESNYTLFKEKLLQGLAISISVHFEVENAPLNYFEGLDVISLRDDVIIHFGIVKKKGAIFSENTEYFLSELRSYIAETISQKTKA